MRTLLILIPFAAVVVAGFALRNPEARDGEQEFQRLSDDLDARIAAFEAIERPRPPLFGDTVPGEAWDYYRKALPLLESVTENVLDRYDDEEVWFRLFNFDTDLAIDGAPLPDFLRTYHELAQPVILQVMLGARAKYAEPSYDLRHGYDFTLTIEERDPLFESTRVASAVQTPLLVQAAQLAADGDPRGAVDALLTLYRLGEDLGRGGPIIHHLLELSLEGRAVRGLADLLGTGGLPDDQLDRLIRVLGPKLARRDRWQIIEGEFLNGEATLRRFARGERPLDVYIGEGGGVPKALLDPRNALEAWRIFRDLLPAFRVAHPAGDVDSVEAAEADLARAKEEHQLAWPCLPSLELLADFWREERARYEALRLSIALVRFVRREGRVPATVAEFRPASVPASSEAWSYRIDPESGRPEIVLAEDEEEDEERPFFRLR